jgi:hypothetical protein
VPARTPEIEQVNVPTLDEPVGPVVEVHGTAPPPGPVTVQVTAPVGVASPLGPVTVAVKTRVAPGEMLWELSVTDIVGGVNSDSTTTPSPEEL